MRSNFEKDVNYPWTIRPILDNDEVIYNIGNNIDKEKSVNIPFYTFSEAESYIKTHLK